jgi:GTPase SAR1 family protein
MGPAGSGKSTYCASVIALMESHKRRGRLLNLDPAAEHFQVEADADVRDLITLDDVTEHLGYGPNGGLVYCLEYLVENLDWLDEALGVDTSDDDYWIIDCPGQIELYTHFPVMRKFVEHLQHVGFTICGVYCVEAPFVTDPFKYFSACLTAMSAMIQMEIPHVNILTKMDLIKDTIDNKRYLLMNDTYM